MNKEVTWGMLIKLIICMNIVVLAFCFVVCNVRTTQDQETLEYINHLENRVELQHQLIELYEEVYK